MQDLTRTQLETFDSYKSDERFESLKPLLDIDSLQHYHLHTKQQMQSDPNNVWIELLTNIPKSSDLITFKFTTHLNRLVVDYRQNGPGPSWNTLRKNLASVKFQNGVLVNDVKQKGSADGSIYGYGLMEILTYIDENYGFYIYSRPENGEAFKIDFAAKGKERVPEIVDALEASEWDYGFRLVFHVKKHAKIDSWRSYIESGRSIIAWKDSHNISSGGRQYKFEISDGNSDGNFLSNTDIEVLTAPLDSIRIPKNPDGISIKADEHKILTELVISARDYNGKDKGLTVYVNEIYKRSDNPKNLIKQWEWDGDKPYLIIRYKETGQILMSMPLRKGGGKVHLNNMVVDVSISKLDLISFFETPDKAKGLNDSLRLQLSKIMESHLNKLFPNTKVQEKQIQEYAHSLIVGDGNLNRRFRKLLGLQYMDEMSVEGRKNIVSMEYRIEYHRFDIVVQREVDGPKMLIEVKRNSFKTSDANQMYRYGMDTQDTQNIQCMVCISLNVNADAKKTSEKLENSLRKAKTLYGVDIKLIPIIDIADWGY